MGNLTNISAKWTMGNIGDLTTPTSTQQYVLGDVLTFSDSDYTAVKKYMYVKSHTALTAYQPYAIAYGSTAGAEVVTAAPLTIAAPGAYVCVPQVAFTSGYYGWVLIQGDGKALMTSETYIVGDMLQLVTTGTTLVVDGTSGNSPISANTCAVCKEAGSTAVARKMMLIGQMAVIAAS